MQFLDLKREYKLLKSEINHAVKRVLESGNYIGGEEVENFEKEFAQYCGSKYAISTASGTDALFLSLKSLDIKAGDEVITTPYTFIATSEAIMNLGAIPVFVDIKQSDYNINPDLIEEKITKKTKVILPVHLFGKMCDISRIMEIAEKNNIYVIEDACQAIGAEYNKKKAGTFGNLGCFSFYPTKNLGGVGDGGMIITDNDELNKKIRILKNHGQAQRYLSSMLGINSRLDAIQAAILRVKLKHIDEFNEERRHIAKYYLENIGQTFFPESIYHQIIVKVKDNRVNTKFPSMIYYPVPLHLQIVFLELGYLHGNFPVAEFASRTTLAVPFTQKKKELDKIIREIKHYV